uniref:Ribosomal protein L13 n=1 Tax=Cryptomonas sp. SAG 977-2f TaxID=279061 RepID=A0A679CB77_9CRYP|nr:ribosomal protein L13 [Cryptomonas sp. SAG 977-2f]
MNKTVFYTKQNDDYKWFLVDADSKTLGRVSSEISKVLIGKTDVTYNPSQKAKNVVIVINAEKVCITGKKESNKFYYRHSGTPGGLTIETFQELRKRLPVRIIEKSVKNMLPKGSLGRNLFTKLKVYMGKEHPHRAQNPIQITYI